MFAGQLAEMASVREPAANEEADTGAARVVDTWAVERAGDSRVEAVVQGLNAIAGEPANAGKSGPLLGRNPLKPITQPRKSTGTAGLFGGT